MLVRCVIRFGEIAAPEQSGSNGIEVTRKDGAVIRHDGVLFFLRRTLFPVVCVPVASLDERQMGDCRHGLNASKGGNSLLQLVQHFVFGRGNLKAEDVFGTESRIDAKYVDQGAHQQAGSSQKNETQGNFGGNEEGGPATSRRGCRAANFFEVLCQVQPAGGEEWGEPENGACK